MEGFKRGFEAVVLVLIPFMKYDKEPVHSAERLMIQMCLRFGNCTSKFDFFFQLQMTFIFFLCTKPISKTYSSLLSNDERGLVLSYN